MTVCVFGSATFAGTVIPQRKMGEPLPGLTPQQLNRFNVGRLKFNEPLTVANGLGPIFNKPFCGNCHTMPLGGTGSITVTRFGTSNKGVFDPLEDWGGSLLQASAISLECQEFIPEIATIIEPRVTNGALAFGLIEAISNQALLDNRDSQPGTVQGTAHMVSAFEDDPKTPPNSHVGRFGWKAQVATVLTFSADASLNEMGLTNRFVLTENDPNGIQPPSLGSPDFCDQVPDPEDGPDGEGLHFIDHVTFFQRFLGPPPQTPKLGMTGEGLFNTIGCAVCHTPSFTTDDNPNLEDAIRNKVIRPYSDFLLHQMGEAGDPIVQGMATDGMVKTPPLWGLRKRDPMWHNGFATPQGEGFEGVVRAAIGFHNSVGSQASLSAIAFDNLSAEDEALVIAFLGSLGQVEFDGDGDDNVNLDDFTGFRACYGTKIDPDLPCAIHDIDQDGDADLDDFASFMLVYAGPRRDCNSNGIFDLLDILTGAVADADNNGFADACEPTCDGDFNGTGGVDIQDLLAVVNQWGACAALPAPCSADFDFDGSVDTADLLAMISAWGTCSP
ncbi:MAG: hypothetical protein L0Y44_00065 [Phycisphaerales bacterium]|nr:hypothetical protein [Phycisphaerales bacterium]